VVALAAGAFAERCAVDATALAPLPPTVDPAHAAALPVAGLAALQALRAAGLAPGKRVLVTGASGGVGHFAVQIAAHAGAHVIASVGSPGRGDDLTDAGANEIIIGLDSIDEPLDIVLDNVGGSTLTGAWDLLAPGGSLQSIDWSSSEPATFRPYATVGPPKSLTSFLISAPVGDDLATLVTLLEAGHLTVDIGWQGPWNDIDQAADAMLGRTLRGSRLRDRLTRREVRGRGERSHTMRNRRHVEGPGDPHVPDGRRVTARADLRVVSIGGEPKEQCGGT
jgi:NADPH:quinone reductase-like Zn-dependent oxidoreductase